MARTRKQPDRRYGVSTLSPKFKGSNKWSDRLRDTFKHQGKNWNDSLEARIKANIADLVETDPKSALNVHKRNAFDALVVALEAKLLVVAQGKT